MIKTCIDCNWYDDVLREDTFMFDFGDDSYICYLCLEKRGVGDV